MTTDVIYSCYYLYPEWGWYFKIIKSKDNVIPLRGDENTVDRLCLKPEYFKKNLIKETVC